MQEQWTGKMTNTRYFSGESIEVTLLRTNGSFKICMTQRKVHWLHGAFQQRKDL